MKNSALDKLLKVFWFAPADAFLRAHEAIIWSELSLESPVLDIGCGDAEISTFVMAKHKQIDVGMDLNPLGAEKTGLYRKVITGDATKMEFGDRTFSTVISNSTFEHIAADAEAVSEVSRVLKKDGTFYLTVPTPLLGKTIRGILGTDSRFDAFNERVAHYHYRSEKSWTNLLNKNGLDVQSVKQYFPKKSIHIWFRLFKLATWKVYKRELWSYLKDSPYGKLVPNKIITAFLSWYLDKHLQSLWVSKGGWMLIEAKKKVADSN